MTDISRRRLIGAIAAVPAALAVHPASALAFASDSDAHLDRLIAEWQSTKDAWTAASEREEDADSLFWDARKALTAPAEPNSGLPEDILDMTLREIRAASDTPEHKAAWSAYEAAKTEHEQRLGDLKEELSGAAEREQKAAYTRWRDAFGAVVDHVPENVGQLTKKFALIAEDYCFEDIPEEITRTVLADMRRLCAA